jgi:hypothetical protein
MRYHYAPIWMTKIKNSKNEMLARMQRTCITHTLLWRMWNDTTTLENSLTVSLKTKHVIIIKSSNSILGHLSQRHENLCSHKSLYVSVPGSSICNRKNWSQLRCPSADDWLKDCDTQVPWNTHTREYQKTINTHNNLDESLGDQDERRKQITKSYTPYDSISITLSN